MMKLAIISHTKHYKNHEGRIVGWGPTVSEINNLALDFDEIYHIAFLYPGEPPASALSYTSQKIKFVPLQPVGGTSMGDKMEIIRDIPRIIGTVKKTLKKVDIFQLRTPTGIAVFLVPYLTFFSKTRGWYKYAGNWGQKNGPMGYTVQKWMLKNQKRSVTINGRWPKQPSQCISFENPCLTNEEREDGAKIVATKDLNTGLQICFVGGLNKEKGIDLIFEALKNIQTPKIEKLHVVGDGALMPQLKAEKSSLNVPVQIHGSLSKEAVFDIYKKCHFIILPSQNEGFPKVIGEAMNFGCVPIVSNVSCIGQYVKNDENGLLIENISAMDVEISINKCLEISNQEYRSIIKKNYNLAQRFTYDYYRERLKTEIIKKK